MTERHPPVDLGQLNEAALGLREMYSSLRAAGFSMTEACSIIGSWLANSAGGSKDGT